MSEAEVQLEEFLITVWEKIFFIGKTTYNHLIYVLVKAENSIVQYKKLLYDMQRTDVARY